MALIVITMLFLRLFKPIKITHKLYNKLADKLLIRKDLRLEIGRIKVLRYNKFEISGISVTFSNRVLKADRIIITVVYKHLLRKRILEGCSALSIEHAGFYPNQETNSSPVIATEKDDTYVEWEKLFYPLYKKIAAAFFEHAIAIRVKELEVNVSGRLMQIAELQILDNNIQGEVYAMDSKVNFTAVIDRPGKTITVNKANADILDQSVGIENIYLFFRESYQQQDKESLISFKLGLKGIQINNENISLHSTYINIIELDFEIRFSSSHFLIADNSGGIFESIPFVFKLYHKKDEPELVKMNFLFKIDKAFIDAIPYFSNSGLKHILFEGAASIRIIFMFSLKNIFYQFFDISCLENDIKIVDFNAFNLSHLKDPLERSVYNINQRKPADLKKSDDGFVSIENISFYLIKVIVSSEDPTFFQHKGIDILRIGLAIAANLSSKKFKRGASTITMQLVRNLFLNHEKNLFRKLEEIIITLLIENYINIPKKRILELYFNIIEFAPDVYGVKHACDFYFSKLPSELSLTECIVLSYIIPRPKHFYDALVMDSPILKKNIVKYMESFSDLMIQRGVLSEEETKDLNPVISFSNNLGSLSLV
jgi:hypothetical protein